MDDQKSLPFSLIHVSPLLYSSHFLLRSDFLPNMNVTIAYAKLILQVRFSVQIRFRSFILSLSVPRSPPTVSFVCRVK